MGVLVGGTMGALVALFLWECSLGVLWGYLLGILLDCWGYYGALVGGTIGVLFGLFLWEYLLGVQLEYLLVVI